MGIRSRLLLVAVPLVIGTFFFISSVVSDRFLSQFVHIESELAEQNVDRALDAISGTLDDINVSLVDWAQWDDTYAFMQDRNQEYLQSNFGDGNITLDGIKMDAMIFIDTDGSIVTDKNTLSDDPASNVSSEELNDEIAFDGFIGHGDDAPSRKGIIHAGGEPFLVASQPILKTDGTGPSMGTLVFARHLDDTFIEEISNRIHMPLKFYTFLESLPLSDEQKASFATDRPDTFDHIVRVEGDVVAGYGVLHDAFNMHSHFVRIEMPRSIYVHSQSVIRFFTIFFGVTFSMFLIVLMLLLERLVFSPLSYLNTEIVDIRLDKKKKLSEERFRKDQFFNLAIEINAMLDVLYAMELKQAEDERKLEIEAQELQKFRRIAESSFDHIVITDVEGKITYANAAAEKNTGYSIEEMIGKTPRLWGGQMGKAFYDKMWQTIRDEKTSYAVDITNKKKSGETYLAEARISPVLNASGDIVFFFGIERDVTEKRRAELESIAKAKALSIAKDNIEKEKEKTESILNFLRSIGDGVFATDISGRIIFMNEMAESLSGISFENAQGKGYDEIFHFVYENNESSEYPDFVGKVLRTGVKAEITDPTLLIGKNDARTSISNDASPIFDENQVLLGCVVVLQDVTRERSLERMKDSFLSVAAHQLRTPLGSMRWNMEMLLAGDVGKIGDEPKEVVQNVYENIRRLVFLVNDLLNVSKIDQGTVTETPVAIDVVTVIREAIKTLSPDAKNSGIRVSIEGSAADQLLMVNVPPRRFYESMQNLLSNAIKYNKPGGEAVFLIEKSDDNLLISIRDTGIGIPKDGQKMVFSKFFRADNAVLTETEGTGLGLFVVKSFIEESGGKIWFESEENKGTAFFVELPLYDNMSTGVNIDDDGAKGSNE